MIRALALLLPVSAHAIIQTVPAYQPGDALPDYNYILKFLLCQVLLFYGGGSVIGFLKEKYAIQVGVSRKVFCMLFFALSFIFPWILPAEGISWGQFMLASTTLTVLLISSLARPVRKSFLPSRLVFSVVSREGEHSQTLKWLASEAIVTSIVIYVLAHFIESVPHLLLLVPAIASGLGDAAAEIVGTRWGKHHYRTPGFFVEKSFTRSYEGSLAFFVVTAIASGVFSLLVAFPLRPSEMTGFLILPVILTAAEAVAPHS